MGKVIIFSAPSGAGKSTIVNYLLSKNLGLEFSISATCRAPVVKKYMAKNTISFLWTSLRKKLLRGSFWNMKKFIRDVFMELYKVR